MKVNLDLQSFPVYNQRMDLELSTERVGVRFLQHHIHLFRALDRQRLDDAARSSSSRIPNLTPADWNPADFLPGPQASLRDAEGRAYGFCLGSGRDRHGRVARRPARPGRRADAQDVRRASAVCQAINGKDGSAAFVNDNLHHWNFVPYLMGFGGKVFRGPPRDLMPMLDTPEAITAAEYYANLIAKFGPPGLLSYTNDQSVRAQLLGRGNIRTHGDRLVYAAGPLPRQHRQEDRAVRTNAGWDQAGNFHGIEQPRLRHPPLMRSPEGGRMGVHQVGDESARRCCASCARRATARSAADRSSPIRSIARNSDPKRSGRSRRCSCRSSSRIGSTDYMNYRSVSVFPQVGDKINKAIEAIASGQMNAPNAMRQAQAQAVADLKRAGIAL